MTLRGRPRTFEVKKTKDAAIGKSDKMNNPFRILKDYYKKGDNRGDDSVLGQSSFVHIDDDQSSDIIKRMSKEVTNNELSNQIETLALAVANGFEDTKSEITRLDKKVDRLENKVDHLDSGVGKLEHKVDNWMDRTSDRVVVVERKLGIDPGKSKVAVG